MIYCRNDFAVTFIVLKLAGFSCSFRRIRVQNYHVILLSWKNLRGFKMKSWSSARIQKIKSRFRFNWRCLVYACMCFGFWLTFDLRESQTNCFFLTECVKFSYNQTTFMSKQEIIMSHKLIINSLVTHFWYPFKKTTKWVSKKKI